MIPTQLTFRQVQPSSAITARVRAAAQKLERYYDRIVACHVVISVIQRHQHRADPYRVRIELSVPRKKLVIDRRPAHRATTTQAPSTQKTEATRPELRHQDLYVALHDAFDAARRQLEDFVRKQRSREKVAA